MPFQPQPIVDFWFEQSTPEDWFKKNEAFDRTIATRFADVLDAARAAELEHWRESAEGALAEVIVLDQFSRNVYRDDPRAFSHDAQALVLAQESIRKGQDQALDVARRRFLYMPFMHSESREIQKRSIELFRDLGDENTLDFAIRHKDIIDRFGRYPHRNAILGRVSSEDEAAFLEQPGSSF